MCPLAYSREYLPVPHYLVPGNGSESNPSHVIATAFFLTGCTAGLYRHATSLRYTQGTVNMPKAPREPHLCEPRWSLWTDRRKEVCMAIYIHCPSCNERLEVMRQECPHCGVSLPPGVLYALASALGITPPPSSGSSAGQVPHHVSPSSSLSATSARQERQTTPTHHSTLRPWLAALLSVICGLGQLYNGQILKGVVLLLCGIATVVTWHFLPVKVLALFLWVYAMSDAYLVAQRTTPKRR